MTEPYMNCRQSCSCLLLFTHSNRSQSYMSSSSRTLQARPGRLGARLMGPKKTKPRLWGVAREMSLLRSCTNRVSMQRIKLTTRDVLRCDLDVSADRALGGELLADGTVLVEWSSDALAINADEVKTSK